MTPIEKALLIISDELEILRATENTMLLEGDDSGEPLIEMFAECQRILQKIVAHEAGREAWRESKRRATNTITMRTEHTEDNA